MWLCLLLLSVSLAALHAQTRTYQPSDYLPLAVGNSWVYQHEAGDTDDGVMRLGSGVYAQVTVSIDTTEVIDGNTYYLFSDMPAGPSAPPHCIVGKKVRWDGRRLMEHTGSGEVDIFRFAQEDSTYSISTTHGDTKVKVFGKDWDSNSLGRPPFRVFEFTGHDVYDDWIAEESGRHSSRQMKFVAGFGMGSCGEWLLGSDYGAASNSMHSISATLLRPPTSGGASEAGGASGASGASGAGASDTPDTVTTSYWDARYPDRSSE